MAMRSNSQRANCGMRFGGGMAKTRDVGGIKAPTYGNSSSVMNDAKGETTGIVGRGGIGADGVPVKSSLARPGRKFGGRAMKEDKKTPSEEEADKADGDDDAKYARGGFLSGMKKGALHRELGVPEGEKIPAKKLAKAAHSDNPTERRRAKLAETMKKWKHK